LVGDPTSAAQRAADVAAWAFDEAAISALHAVIEARRDVRRFRPDEVPPDTLRQVFLAGHRAPSVGHCQPWRFIVVRNQSTRDKAALMADRERLRQAEMLTEDRRSRLLDLQLEGSGRHRRVSSSPAIAERRLPACSGGRVSATQICGAGRARSRTCGWRRAPWG
jgi:hypothetical protein